MDAEVEGWPYGPGELPVFLDADGFWAMPLPGGQLRLFVRDDDAGERPEVADGQAVIDRHLPGGARISSAENCACFSLHHRVAARFRSGRVLLAGDAAHAMTPVSGQQLTAGHHAVLPRCDLGHDLPRGHDLTFHNNVNLCSGRNSPPPATPRAPGSS